MPAARSAVTARGGNRVRRRWFPLARGYSQRQLAARVRALGRPMTFTVLSRIERTVRRCDVDDLVAIAAALGTPPQAFLGNASEHPQAATAGAT
ncbi:helix-turn-helix domain-containing protein [Streptomyces sp. NPDC090036]|uniref:helix-turn-helix domain-containing protein n=1 Tax=Streptomyces sp. NPDC090036 TaxID=3365926 RepID=UPI003828AF34